MGYKWEGVLEAADQIGEGTREATCLRHQMQPVSQSNQKVLHGGGKLTKVVLLHLAQQEVGREEIVIHQVQLLARISINTGSWKKRQKRAHKTRAWGGLEDQRSAIAPQQTTAGSVQM